MSSIARRLFSISTSTFKMQPHRIRTAAMLVIGDEILNGKIKDTNSQFFADFCFRSGIELRRIAVVPDEKQDIVDVLNDLRSRVDFIVTSGGIGPTHDDITYESIAAAFDLGISLHEPTIERMNALSQNPPKTKVTGSDEQSAQLRMALFPTGPNVATHYVDPKLWVPVVSLEDKVYIFPGVPSLFTHMVEGLLPTLADRIDSPKLARRYVSTKTVESELAPILSEVHQRYVPQGVKVGSYPHFQEQRNTVSIIGPDDSLLKQIVVELEKRINGKEISIEEESKSS